MTDELKKMRQWVGRIQTDEDLISPGPLRAMAALLDQDPLRAAQFECLPPLWHWLFFLAPVRQSKLAEDGHALRGDFLPPVALPRRMWAGGRLWFHDDIPVPSAATRNSTIKSVDAKSGRSGDLVFIEVAHDISVDGQVVLREEHDIVYRQRQSPAAVKRIPAGTSDTVAKARFSRQHVADAALLFRYSALTFNAHRIHYDRDYAVNSEGYGGLVVHGPLLATLLVELLREEYPDSRILEFAFRAIHPVFDAMPFRACGNLTAPHHGQLWITDHQDRICMEATARLEPCMPGRGLAWN